MDATVIVAGMGLAATLLSAWMTARMQLRGDRAGRILDAKVRIYGDCSDALYEYERATFNRVKHRLEGQPGEHREPLRQEAYRLNARTRSAIGQVSILSGNESLRDRLEQARQAVGGLNASHDQMDLNTRHEALYEAIKDALEIARCDLTR